MFPRRSRSLELLKVPLESRITRLAFVLSERFVALEDLRGFLVCFDLSGRRVWEEKVECSYPSALRLRVARNRIWLDCRDRILCFDFEGNEQPALVPPVRENERVGQFVVGAQDVAVSLYREENQFEEDAPDLDLCPRVMRLGADGDVRWQTDLPVQRLSFSGVVSASAATNWKAQPMAVWRPRSWTADCYVNDGLLLSGDVLLASYIDISSGIGFSYALRWSNGQLLWTSEMCPYSFRGINGVGSFIFSVLGYGESRTFVLDEHGENKGEWKRSGPFCVVGEGEVWLAEQGQTTIQLCHAFVLGAGNTERQGARLSSYEGAQPALGEDGLIFWRAGQLLRVDSHGRKHVLNSSVGDPKSRVLSRMLLDEHGTLVFATAGVGAAYEDIESCLWIAREPLAPLGHTPWPCGEGNPQANPVWRERL